jgi:hypothetical protein
MGGNLGAIQLRWGVHLTPAQLDKVEIPRNGCGKAKPEQDFPIGSEWHYGPVYENMETRVRVIKAPHRANNLRDNGLNVYAPVKGSRSRRMLLDQGPRSWFVECEVISSPFHATGEVMSLPPSALIPADYVDAERGLRSNCGCCGASLCAASLRRLPWCCESDPRDERIAQLEIQVEVLTDQRNRAIEQRRAVTDKLDAAREALR